MIFKKSLFQHYHNVFISRVLALTISHVFFTVKALLFPENLYLWIYVSLHPSAVEPRARIGFLSGDRNDAKYALKYTHKNEEVGSLTTTYSLLVTQPVSNCNRQDLQCVQHLLLRGFARYVFLVNFFEKHSLHWKQEKSLFDSYHRFWNERVTRLMAMWIREYDPSGGSAERQLYSQARNHCASNSAIFENTIQHVQEI